MSGAYDDCAGRDCVVEAAADVSFCSRCGRDTQRDDAVGGEESSSCSYGRYVCCSDSSARIAGTTRSDGYVEVSRHVRYAFVDAVKGEDVQGSVSEPGVRSITEEALDGADEQFED